MATDSGQVTTVTIFNQTYHVRSGDDPEYVLGLAGYVDEKMVELSRNTTTVDTLKVAILAALNIADEYLSTRKRLDELERTVEHSADRIARLVESAAEMEEA